MKKFFLCSLLLIGIICADAQNNDYKKSPTLLVNLAMYDFKTPLAIRSTSLNAVLSNKKWSKFNAMDLGFGLTYLKGLNNNIDFVSNLNGAFLKYPFRGKPSYNNSSLLLEADAGVNVKLLSDKYCVVPYLTVGFGVSKYASVFGAYMPVGAGLQVKLFQETFLLANIQYRLPISQESNYHMLYSFGIGSVLGKN